MTEVKMKRKHLSQNGGFTSREPRNSLRLCYPPSQEEEEHGFSFFWALPVLKCYCDLWARTQTQRLKNVIDAYVKFWLNLGDTNTNTLEIGNRTQNTKSRISCVWVKATYGQTSWVMRDTGRLFWKQALKEVRKYPTQTESPSQLPRWEIYTQRRRAEAARAAQTVLLDYCSHAQINYSARASENTCVGLFGWNNISHSLLLLLFS